MGTFKFNQGSTAAFTGHRYLPYGMQDSIKAKVEKAIRERYFFGRYDYLCGMALGFDLLATEVVLSLKSALPSIRLIAVIPFRNQCERWNEADKERYQRILEQADRIIVLSEHYYDGCYLRRNDFMLNSTDTLIAYWDEHSVGGTFYTVNKAKAKDKRIVNVYVKPKK